MRQAPQQQRRRNQCTHANHIQRRGGTAGEVLDAPDHYRADDATELAQRIDQRNA